MRGLSVRTIFLNFFFQIVIFLYLLDNDTSWMILLSSGVGLVIEGKLFFIFIFFYFLFLLIFYFYFFFIFIFIFIFIFLKRMENYQNIKRKIEKQFPIHFSWRQGVIQRNKRIRQTSDDISLLHSLSFGSWIFYLFIDVQNTQILVLMGSFILDR